MTTVTVTLRTAKGWGSWGAVPLPGERPRTTVCTVGPRVHGSPSCRPRGAVVCVSTLSAPTQFKPELFKRQVLTSGRSKCYVRKEMCASTQLGSSVSGATCHNSRNIELI